MKNYILGFSTFMIVSCGYNNTKIPGNGPMGKNEPPGKNGTQVPGKDSNNPQGPQLDFALVKSQFLEVHCLRCHSAAGGNRAGINLETYSSVQPLVSLVQNAVNSGFMPPSGNLPESAKAVLNNWIQAGAPEVATGSNNPVPPGSEKPTNPSPSPGSPTIPCEDHKHQVMAGELVEIDSQWVFDVTDQTLKGRHDDCHR